MKQTFESRIARLLFMSEEAWKRHANPLSVWTRLTTLPILIVAIWSRIWIGYFAWVPVILAIIWIWMNPRLFKEPISTKSWASKGVLGERIWLNRKNIPIPSNHRVMPRLLTILSGLGLPFLGWGLFCLVVWPTVFGCLIIYVGKLWFLDRMVWLFEDMKDSAEEYSSWLYDYRAEPVAGTDGVR